jgi:hypothetical protein
MGRCTSSIASTGPRLPHPSSLEGDYQAIPKTFLTSQRPLFPNDSDQTRETPRLPLPSRHHRGCRRVTAALQLIQAFKGIVWCSSTCHRSIAGSIPTRRCPRWCGLRLARTFVSCLTHYRGNAPGARPLRVQWRLLWRGHWKGCWSSCSSNLASSELCGGQV